MSSDITVVIPTYNAADCIETTLATVDNQTLKADEIIIVDDGSSDDTVELVNRLAKQTRNVPIRIFKQNNAGAGAARNRGVINAKTKYIAFLDADDEWESNKLERSIYWLEKEKATFVSHDIINRYSDGNEELLKCAKRFNDSCGDKQVSMFLKNYLAISAVIIKREDLLNSLGFDSERRYSLDFDLWHAVLHQPNTSFYVFDEPLVTYNISEGALSSNIIGRLQCSELYIYRFINDISAKYAGSKFFLVIYKTLLINYEALTMAKLRKLYGKFLLVLLRLPYSLIKTASMCMFGKRYVRKNYFSMVK